MKGVLIAATLFVTLNTMAEELPVADPAFIAELKEFCTEVANDEGVSAEDLNAFLLSCINDELESEGYQPIKKVP